MGSRRSKRKGYIKKASGCSKGIVPQGENKSIWVHLEEWVAPGARVLYEENINGISL
jgi:hypothetical protein